MNSATDPGVDPITPASLPALAWATARADLDTYRRSRRPSLLDVLLSVWPPLRAPIFLVGAPRSGTTFLGSCLATLPEVSYHFEPVATKAAARCVYDGSWSRGTARLFYRAVYRWLLRIHLDGTRRLADKTPRYCFIIDFLAETFPEAQFVFIARDGRDAALSYSEQPWLQAAHAGTDRREPGGYPFGPFPRFWVEPDRRAEFARTTDLHRCIWAWRRHNEAALRQLNALPAERALRVRYEALVTAPEVDAVRILDFLGIDRTASRSAFLAAAAGAHDASVGRWQSELHEADLQMMEREAGVVLREQGYLSGSGTDPGTGQAT